MTTPVNEGPVSSAVAGAATSAISTVGKAIAKQAIKKVGPSLLSKALQNIATTGKADTNMLSAVQPLMKTVLTILSTPALRTQFFKLVKQAQQMQSGQQPQKNAPGATAPAPAPGGGIKSAINSAIKGAVGTPAPAAAPGARKESREQSLTDMLFEEFNPEDKVTLNIPLFLRVMEYAKEDAKTDMDLHDVTEKVIALSEHGDTLTMDHYDQIVSGPSGGQDSEEPMRESVMESITECGMVPTSATGEPQTRFTVSKTTTDTSGAGSVNVSGDAKDTETLNQLLKLAGLNLTVSDQPPAQEVTPCGAAVQVSEPMSMNIEPEFDDGPDMGDVSYSTNGNTLKDLLVNRMRDKFAQ